VCHCRGRTDTRPLLRSLHWLPVRQRVIYKVALLTNKVRTTATLAYLSNLVQTHVPTRTLRSSDAPLLVVPLTQTELARRTFSVAAPSIWNSLPADIRLCESVSTFKCHLKTHLVLLCCKRLCIFGPQGAIHMCCCCYYYNYFLCPPAQSLWA